MNFDVVMPATLFAVTVFAVLSSEKVERKLKAVFEDRTFRARDAVLLVATISVAVCLITMIPQMALMTIFLLAYSLLLFIFTYIFSDMEKVQAELFCLAFAIISFAAGTASLYYSIFTDIHIAYGALALYGLCFSAFMALIYEEQRSHARERWYLAVLPSILFVILYIFFSKTAIWFPYLLNLYGLVFAVLVILYFGSLFTWKTSVLFAGLLTVADVVLVLITRSMVSAATHVSSLRLPVLVVLPTFPQVGAIGLGLGDFFFAGLLAIQTYKKFGRNVAFLSSAAMAVSFFIFEALILSFGISAFPGTLMIACGWLLTVPIKFLRDKTEVSRDPPL